MRAHINRKNRIKEHVIRTNVEGIISNLGNLAFLLLAMLSETVTLLVIQIYLEESQNRMK